MNSRKQKSWLHGLCLIAAIWSMSCGQGFDAIESFRAVSVSTTDLGEFALASASSDKELRLSDPITFTVPEDLGPGGSVTLIVRPKSSFTQDHLFTAADESEPNSSVAEAQSLAAGTVQVSGSIGDSDTESTIMSVAYQDVYSLSHTATGDRVLMLTGGTTSSDFDIAVFDATASSAPDTSSADSDGGDAEVDVVKYTISSNPETRLFALNKMSNDGTDISYRLSNFPLTTESEPNDSEATAQSLNVSASSYQAIEGAADSTDTNDSVSINGQTANVEDFFTFSVPRISVFTIALKIDTPATADLDLYTVNTVNGTVTTLISVDDQITTPSVNVESVIGVAFPGEPVKVYVDALTGSSAYILGLQVISETATSTPTVLLGQLQNPSGTSLFNLLSPCTSTEVFNSSCSFEDDDIYQNDIEVSGLLNQGFGASAYSIGFPHNNESFPLDSDGEVVAGDYSVAFSGGYFDLITVDDDNEVTAEVTAIVKRDQDPNFGTLNINLYFIGETVIDSATSTDGSERIDQVVESLQETYDQAGVQIGTVNRINLSGTEFDALSVGFDVNDQDAVQTVLDSIEREDGFLNVFVVDTFSLGGLLGFSIGIPGLPVVDGFPATGVFFAMLEPFEEQSSASFKLFRDTFAHEVGHYLGLFHPTEASGTEFDPLSDTDQCTQEDNDNNNDGVVSFSECNDAGASNLMFWSAPDSILNANTVTTNLTSQQGFVMNVNSYVR